MCPLGVLVLAILSSITSNTVFRPHDPHIPNSEVTIGYDISNKSSEGYGVSNSAFDSAVGFAQPGVVADVGVTPTVVVILEEQRIPTRTVCDPAIEPEAGIIYTTIRNTPGHLNSLSSDLVMGLAHTLLLMVYYTTFKPLWRSMFNRAISQFPYAICFWLSIALFAILEPILTFGWNYLHREFHASHEAVMKRLRRSEAKAWGQTILIKALEEAKDHSMLTLEALTASHEHIKTRISEVEEQFLGVSRAVTQQDEDVRAIVRTVTDMVHEQHSIREQVGELSTTLQEEHANHCTCVNRFIHAYGSNIITIGHHADCLQQKVDVLERQNLEQAAEIDALKSAVKRSDEERAAMIGFYRKQKFNNMHVNEYYQKAIAEAPEDQLAPAFMAYMTAMHSQMNATLQGVYRSAGGHSQQSNNYGRPPNGSPGFGSPGLGSSRYGPAGNFPFNQRK
ncbi:hypothetical protein COCMIDRAFT_36355 [Bipolaris oryzae ATCC 44560]|uniref:Uncharacterized protein n=1 Tax=Bipolaris oryzae ATCC 44560 TaxID=930090 RepID=W6ZEL5_COCMI|nr:uncharacterized protein COCMIDRAFT_36355 [Bipolaris oryzae ATCC 44560]EUC45949.1 hypothetical protein COCMIDRAFT_36355 [Bipolaris oryzae ATCC 44560]